MTSRERLESLLDDRPIDRVPVYLQIPFALTESGMKPGAFHGYADLDDWRECDPLYCELVSRMERECDNPFIWRPDCMQNLQFFASVSDTRSEPGISIEERVRFF